MHGSAPDIGGQDIANPLAMVLSAAMMCRYGLNMPQVRQEFETALTARIACCDAAKEHDSVMWHTTDSVLFAGGRTP